MERASVNSWTLPITLGIVFLIPGVMGIVKVAELTLAWDWSFRFDPTHSDNLPLALHALFSVIFLGGGAFQIVSGLRKNKPTRHATAGRYIAIAGLLGAASALWLTARHPEISTWLLLYGRVLFASLWMMFILLAIRAILRRNVGSHKAHMLRAYAIAANAGTIAFVYIPIMAIWGEPPALISDAIQVAGWIANLILAEWFIRRKPRQRAIIAHAKINASTHAQVHTRA